MADFQQQPGSGVLFTVKEQYRKSDKAPDWTGTFTCDQNYKAGDVIKLSAWTKRGNYGELISIRVNNFVPGQPSKQGREVSSHDDDSVPF